MHWPVVFKYLFKFCNWIITSCPTTLMKSSKERFRQRYKSRSNSLRIFFELSRDRASAQIECQRLGYYLSNIPQLPFAVRAHPLFEKPFTCQWSNDFVAIAPSKPQLASHSPQTISRIEFADTISFKSLMLKSLKQRV